VLPDDGPSGGFYRDMHPLVNPLERRTARHCCILGIAPTPDRGAAPIEGRAVHADALGPGAKRRRSANAGLERSRIPPREALIRGAVRPDPFDKLWTGAFGKLRRALSKASPK
jgi:hypothetical protein